MQPRLAVLIDADNISPTFAPAIFSRVAELGVAAVRRLYGRPSAIMSWEKAATDEVYELRPQLGITSAKNGTDIALAIGAMDILHEGLADAFCIVSNDRDFVPLAIRLRAVNRQVHAICTKSDERLLRAFDTVFDLTPTSSILAAFHRIVADTKKHEFGLAEAGTLLRRYDRSGVLPPPGKGKLRKVLEDTGHFEFPGDGPVTRLRLKVA